MTARLSLIAALADNRVIGRDNRMPWHLPEDLKRFKRVTLGAPVIMGRKTFESILAALGKPLPGRTNIVVTRNRDYAQPGCTVASSLDEAIALAGAAEQVFVVGGGEIYAQALPRAQRLYLTLVHIDVDGDAYFPAFAASEWREIEREAGTGDPAFEFVTYERVATPA